MSRSASSPNPLLRLALVGAGSAITFAAAASVWLRLSAVGLVNALQVPRSGARLRRGRVG